MQQPSKTYLVSIFSLCVLVKVLPFVLMHWGLDIKNDAIYPWSLTPIFAVAILGVARFSKVGLGMVVPLAAFVVGDLLIAVLAMAQYGMEGLRFSFYPGMAINYMALLVSMLPGLLVRRRQTVGTLIAASLTAPTVFFVISNFGAWTFDTYALYARSADGLLAAYQAGLPFYRNSLVSTLFYSAVLFSPAGLAQISRSLSVKPRAQQVNEEQAAI